MSLLMLGINLVKLQTQIIVTERIVSFQANLENTETSPVLSICVLQKGYILFWSILHKVSYDTRKLAMENP